MEKVKIAERQRMSQIFSLPTAQTQAGEVVHTTGFQASSAVNSPATKGSVTPVLQRDAPEMAPQTTQSATPALDLAASTDTVSVAVAALIPEKILQWARAVGGTPAMHSGLVFLPTGELRVSKQVLNFGASARQTYSDLFEAGLIVRKGESDAVVKPALANIFKTAMENQSA